MQWVFHPNLYATLSKTDKVTENQLKRVVNFNKEDKILHSKLKIKENKMRIK